MDPSALPCPGAAYYVVFSGTAVSSTNKTDRHDIIKYC